MISSGQELQNLNHRVDAVEDTSRKLAEVSASIKTRLSRHGQGGPARPVNSAAALAALEAKTEKLEREMRMYEAFLRSRGVVPSIWPVFGRLESGVGGRRNPFTRPRPRVSRRTRYRRGLRNSR